MNSTPDEGENLLRDGQDVAPGHGAPVRELDTRVTDVPDLPSPQLDDVDAGLDTPKEADAEEDAASLLHDNTSPPFPSDTNGVDADTVPGHDGLVERDTFPSHGERGDVDTLSSHDGRVEFVDDSASTPDDTPSIRGSVLSSPRSESFSIRTPSRRASPSAVHRPFDARFQSRLSSAQSSPLRSHSRHSSLASLRPPTPSELDDVASPWDVVRWNKLKRVTGQAFSEVARRNFGSPTCLAVADQLVVGTSKGVVLVFDHQQNHKAIIGSGTPAAESGAVTALATSADHTTIAVGHATGHLFTWEVARPARPFLHIPPIELAHAQTRRGDGHLTGSAVLHVGFLGYRHTALVSADDKGMAFSHLATRGMGPVGRVVRTTRILGRYPEAVLRPAKPLKKSSVLAFAPLPLGNVEQRTDGLGLVAMLTPYLLVIVSTTPVAQTQHKAARPKEVAAHSAMTAALAWFPAIKIKSRDADLSKTKLVYAWSNILTILEVHEMDADERGDQDKQPELQFPARSRFQADEAIVAVQWLNKSVLAVLTITQQLLIIEDVTMHVTGAFDLLPKNIYHADLYSQQLRAIIERLDEHDTSMHGVVADAFHMSFRAYKGRLFLLGSNDVWTGALTNWADRLLALMNVGDFIGAIQLATQFYRGEGERATVGLPDEAAARADLVREKLSEMMTASLRYAFGKNQQAGNGQIEKPQLVELADACVKACLVMDDQDLLFDEVFSWYADHEHGALFVDVLEPYIVNHDIVSIPPPALKTMIDHFVTTHSPAALEELICTLDTSTMDIDQVATLCKRYQLYDAYIYVWTMALRDFVFPLTLLLDMADLTDQGDRGMFSVAERYRTAQKVFPYTSFLLTGRVYPTGTALADDEAAVAKSQIYDYFFSGKAASDGAPPPRAGTRPTAAAAGSFDHLLRILHFDAPSFIAALNEAFEDSFLNTADDDVPHASAMRPTYTRQYIVRILLEVMAPGFDADDTVFLDMFIARNLAKYSQYLVLSGSALREIFVRLCHYPEEELRTDAQLSMEYLLSVYQPPSLLDLVPLLQDAQFYRVLKSVFKQEGRYADMVDTFFLDDEGRSDVFGVIEESLRPDSVLIDQQRADVRAMIERHARDMVAIDIPRTARTIDSVMPQSHPVFLHVLEDDAYGQYEYLKALLEPDGSSSAGHPPQQTAVELYVRLMCQFDPAHVREYVERVKDGDIRLDAVLPTIEDSGIIDAAVILEVQQGQIRDAMDRLTRHLALLGSTLKSLRSDYAAGDDVSVHRPVTEVLAAVDRYARVGVWLCQGQMKNAPRPAAVVKSPRRSLSATRVLSFVEQLWLELVLAVVSIAREVSTDTSPASSNDDAELEPAASVRTTVQTVFSALLATTTSMRDGSGARDASFLRILRTFLTQAAAASPSLSALRHVIASIFSAYAYEESLLALSNTMLDKHVFVHLDEVAALRQRGWRPLGQACEICRRRVWGPGVGQRIWEDWQERERSRRARRHRVGAGELVADDEGDRSKGKAAADGRAVDVPSEALVPPADQVLGPLVIFSCRHVFHQRCLGRTQPDDGSAPLLCPKCV